VTARCRPCWLVCPRELRAPETTLAYRPQRLADDPTYVPYHGVQRTLVVAHPEPGRPPLQVRALVVWSPGKARVDAQVRATHLDRLETALHDLAGKLGRRPYTTVAAVEKRVATLLRRHPAGAQVTVTVATDETGPTLTWQRQEAALYPLRSASSSGVSRAAWRYWRRSCPQVTSSPAMRLPCLRASGA
jgi:hypothetical protein